MGNDWLSTLQQILQNLLTGKTTPFLSFAATLITGFGVIRLVMLGIRWMFTGDWDFLSLFREILIIGAAQAMLNGYTTPAAIWGGESFPGMIQKGPQMLAQVIGADAFDALDKTFNTYTEANPAPAALMWNGLSYYVIRILMETTRFAMFFAMSWGFVVSAVCILIGPIFIPFLLFEPLSWMFWGWLRCFIQYSFYPVIGAALVHVFSLFLINVWNSPLGPANGNPPGLAIVPFLVLSIVGTLAAPSLVSHIFSGSSGGGFGGGMLGSAVTKIVSAGAA